MNAHALRSRPIRSQFALFVLVGASAAAVNFGSRALLSLWMGYTTAIVIAYLVGMITAFALNRMMVFKQVNRPVREQIFWFSVVNLAAAAQTVVISLLLAEWIFPFLGFTWYPLLVAHGVGVAAPVFTSFIGHKYLSFRHHA